MRAHARCATNSAPCLPRVRVPAQARLQARHGQLCQAEFGHCRTVRHTTCSGARSMSIGSRIYIVANQWLDMRFNIMTIARRITSAHVWPTEPDPWGAILSGRPPGWGVEGVPAPPHSLYFRGARKNFCGCPVWSVKRAPHGLELHCGLLLLGGAVVMGGKSASIAGRPVTLVGFC